MRTITLLTIITLADIIWGQTGMSVFLWIGYGIYKLLKFED